MAGKGEYIYAENFYFLTLLNLESLNTCKAISQMIFVFQVVAVAFTPVAEMVLRNRTEKGVKDFFREGWVENLGMTMQTVVLEGVGVVEGVVVVGEGTLGEVVGIMKVIPVEEEEVPIMLEKISKMIAVTIQLVMAR